MKYGLVWNVEFVDTERMTILVTGGAGYIGSHTCVQLIEAGYDVVIVDNFANSHPESLHRIEKITGRAPRRETGDIRDRAFLEQVIRQNSKRQAEAVQTA